MVMKLSLKEGAVFFVLGFQPLLGDYAPPGKAEKR